MELLFKEYVSLTKPKIIYLLLVTALGGLFIASEKLPDLWITVTVLGGGALAAGGANAINHYLDRDIDIKMSRTSKRPVASGAIKPAHALVFGISLNIVAFIILWGWGNLLSALLTLSATLFYVFVYTMKLKRTTVQNIVIGGAAGSVPPMVGWAAVNGSILSPEPFLLFALIFFWTPPHFWALSLILKKDYEEAGVPMLPVVAGVQATKKQIFAYTWTLLAITILLTFFSTPLGLIYGISSILLTIGFILMTFRLMTTADIAFAKPTYLYSLAYLALLFIFLMVDSYVV